MLLIVYIEKFIVMETVSLAFNRKVSLAFTSAKRYEYLEVYKKVVIKKKGSLIYYWLLYFFYKHALKYIGVVMLIGMLSFLL